MPAENQESNRQGDHIEIEEVSGGTVAVGQGAQAIGTLIERLEETHIAGDYVERQEISHTILVVGSDGLDQLTAWLAKQQDVGSEVVIQPGSKVPSAQADQQIAEVLAAQQETAAKGVETSPQSAYRLGMLAAYRRDYDIALEYFNQAGSADPHYSQAFESIAWLQQSLAVEAIKRRDYDEGYNRLAKARTAAQKTDPLDTHALALRGYIAKTLAQIAAAQNNTAASQDYYAEAERLFKHIIQIDKENASAYNGLANVQFSAGNYDGAITSSLQAIELFPNYTAAYHDLALAYEAKWRDEPQGWERWCVRALAAWRETYRQAPGDPAFTADKILQIGRRIHDLERYCK